MAATLACSATAEVVVRRARAMTSLPVVPGATAVTAACCPATAAAAVGAPLTAVTPMGATEVPAARAAFWPTVPVPPRRVAMVEAAPTATSARTRARRPAAPAVTVPTVPPGRPAVLQVPAAMEQRQPAM